MFRRLIAPFALVFAIAACTAPLGDLTVVSYSPIDGATDVSIDAVVTATFNRNVAADSLDGNFTLSGGDSNVEGEVTWDVATFTATFTPNAPLAYDTTYTATLSGDITTPNDVAVEGSVSWSFTTVEDPTVDPDPDPAVTGLSVSPGSADLGVSASSTVTLTATVTTVGSPAPTTNVTWESSDEAVATVDADGVVTAVASGTATITATSVADGDFEDSAEITVHDMQFTDADAFAAYAEPADVNTSIDLAFPAFAGAFGDVTFELTGDLPGAFETGEFDDDVVVDGPVYVITFDATDGSISGATGFPGVFAGSVTATDALGQTLTAAYELDLGLAFRLTAIDLETTEDTFSYPEWVEPDPFFIVAGNQVQVSGVADTDLLPPSFLDDLVFTLTYTDSPGSRQPTPEEIGDTQTTGIFRINVGQGAITQHEPIPDITQWLYEVNVTYAVDVATVAYPVRFHLISDPFSD